MTSNGVKKIVIVEDEESLLRVLMEWLSSEGFEVHGIPSGAAAMAAVREVRPDLVLLDLILPEVDGFEILKQIRADARISGIPVVILTNLGDEEKRKAAMDLGATDYLMKAEFNLESVKNVIDKYLNAREENS